MAVRKFASIEFRAMDGTITDQLPAKYGKISLVLDREVNLGGINVKPFARDFCECGYFHARTKDEEWSASNCCPQCGEARTKFVPNVYHFSSSLFENAYYYEYGFVRDKNILVPTLTFDIDPITSKILVKECETTVFKYKSGNPPSISLELSMRDLCGNSETLQHLADLAMAGDPSWTEVISKSDLFRDVYLQATGQEIQSAKLSYEVSMYNAFATLPWTKTTDMRYLVHVVAQINKGNVPDQVMSEDEFLKFLNQPLFLKDVYRLSGFPREKLGSLDDLIPSLKEALRGALIHQYICINDIHRLISVYGHIKSKDVDAFNELGDDFAVFFSKNVLEYRGSILRVYQELQQSGHSSLKEHNLIQLEKYMTGKKVKADRIRKFDQFMSAGDGISAIKSISGLI